MAWATASPWTGRKRGPAVFRSLTVKLTLAFLAVGLIGAILVALFVQQRTQREFDRFVLDRYQVSVLESLADYYQRNGNWVGVNVRILVRDSSGLWSRYRLQRAPVTLTDADGTVIYSGGRYQRGEQIDPRHSNHSVPIQVGGETAGWLSFDLPREQDPPVPDSPESGFLARVNRAILFGALGATGVALLVGVLLARTISRPVRELTAATQMVAKGALGHQVPVRTNNELGELAASFNRMSADLAESNQLRRQMTADIAHELRTPLSVILGYTEALSDRKLAGTPQTFEVLHEEAQHLSLLIEDLRTLSLADSGELPLTRRPVCPEVLLERAASAFAAQAQEQEVSLAVNAEQPLPEIDVDPDRMAQVFGNLISNALRYTPAEGQITLEAHAQDDRVLLDVKDTGLGIAPEDLPYVFERFYRGDRARGQDGESGLGLAIVKSLVEAHDGRIGVQSRVGEGTSFRIELPAAQA
jgi:two-component system sensor histidine kinase BaeS